MTYCVQGLGAPEMNEIRSIPSGNPQSLEETHIYQTNRRERVDPQPLAGVAGKPPQQRQALCRLWDNE